MEIAIKGKFVSMFFTKKFIFFLVFGIVNFIFLFEDVCMCVHVYLLGSAEAGVAGTFGRAAPPLPD
jgi:hypothetical protein